MAKSIAYFYTVNTSNRSVYATWCQLTSMQCYSREILIGLVCFNWPNLFLLRRYVQLNTKDLGASRDYVEFVLVLRVSFPLS